MQECLARWTTPNSSTPGQYSPGSSVLRCSVEPPAQQDVVTGQCRDFALNVAGAAARAKRQQVNMLAPIRNLIARALGIKTEERAWRIGAGGEAKVGRELDKLGDGWRVLHAVEVGEHGADIDHIVIGPPGVISLNSKRHPRGKAWVGDHMVMVNGQRTDYLPKSRFEATRAARLLSHSCGWSLSVTSAIVFVDAAAFTVKQMPADVHVTTRRRLVGWLQSLPDTIDETTVEAIFATARLSTTWTTDTAHAVE